MEKVTVVIGAGAIGQAIARRVSAGKHVLLADLKAQNAEAEIRLLSTTTGAVIDGVDPLQSFCKVACMTVMQRVRSLKFSDRSAA